MQKVITEETTKLEELKTKTMEEREEFKHKKKQFLIDQRSIVYTKKKQDQKIKNAQAEKENAMRILKAKERELNER